MAEPSQSRVDLSDIHPLNRLTLFVLRYLFGACLVLPVGLQYCWVGAETNSRFGAFGVMADKTCVHFTAEPPVKGGSLLRFSYQDYEFGSPIPVAWMFAELMNGTLERFDSIPGLTVARFGQLSRYYAVEVHHLLLIGISGSIYLFVRWRIRRTARMQSLRP